MLFMTQYRFAASSHRSRRTPGLSLTPAAASHRVATLSRRLKDSQTSRSRAASKLPSVAGVLMDLRFGMTRNWGGTVAGNSSDSKALQIDILSGYSGSGVSGGSDEARGQLLADLWSDDLSNANAFQSTNGHPLPHHSARRSAKPRITWGPTFLTTGDVHYQIDYSTAPFCTEATSITHESWRRRSCR